MTCSSHQIPSNKSKDQDWTKEETDYLFDLVREYDSRFYVVSDRYDFPNGTQRSLEVRLVDILRQSECSLTLTFRI